MTNEQLQNGAKLAEKNRRIGGAIRGLETCNTFHV